MSNRDSVVLPRVAGCVLILAVLGYSVWSRWENLDGDPLLQFVVTIVVGYLALVTICLLAITLWDYFRNKE